MVVQKSCEKIVEMILFNSLCFFYETLIMEGISFMGNMSFVSIASLLCLEVPLNLLDSTE